MPTAPAPLRPFAVSMGDPAGIGPEIIAKAWAMRAAHVLSPFFAVGDVRAIRKVWNGPVQVVDSPEDASKVFAKALPCMAVGDAGDFIPGEPTTDTAHAALQSLETAVGLARSDEVAGLVTAPVGKTQLYGIGFTHPGQTEFIAERCGVARDNAVMMLAGPSLKVVPITIHVPLADVPKVLTTELIRARGLITAKGLRRNFGITHPRLVVAGLNPHAGEDGSLGREEIEIIAPAVEALRAEGIAVTGPHAADALFHARARADYDAALCMYHDQALIPVKTLHFDDGVNMTLGLPIVRTSPDHGTAFGIAGKNAAHPGAMIAAIRMAAEAARHRLVTAPSPAPASAA